MNKATPFKLDDRRHYTFYHSELRVINKLALTKQDLNEFETVISKNFIENKTLVGKITGRFGKVEGCLYKKLLELKLPEPSTQNLSTEDENLILEFVQKYSIPVGSTQEMDAYFIRNNNDTDMFSVNWLFIPYETNLSISSNDFFRLFWFKWYDFKRAYEAIKSNDDEKIFQFHNVINNNLRDAYPTLGFRSNLDNSYHPIMETRTSLGLCYLELYNLLIEQQQIKTCPYCNNDFETTKLNRRICDSCKSKNEYKKRYYRSHPDQKVKSRLRMHKVREKRKLNILNDTIQKTA